MQRISDVSPADWPVVSSLPEPVSEVLLRQPSLGQDGEEDLALLLPACRGGATEKEPGGPPRPAFIMNGHIPRGEGNLKVPLNLSHDP